MGGWVGGWVGELKYQKWTLVEGEGKVKNVKFSIQKKKPEKTTTMA